jgi:thioredoxin 1
VLGLVCALGFAVYRMVRAEERRNGIHADPRALRMHKIGAGVVMALVAVLVFWPKSANATKPQPVSDLPTLSDTSLQSELARGKGVMVVEVGANWCPPCRMFAPAVSQVSKEFSGTVPFYFMELDASPVTAKQFQVSDLPCLILFKDGKEAARYVGLTTPTALKEFVKKNSGNP